MHDTLAFFVCEKKGGKNKMNDYLDYLEHSQLGKERKGHKYYVRVPVGKNKLGFTQYRYFYDAREYGAYMQRSKGLQRQITPARFDDHKTTYYTGKSKALPNQEDKNRTFNMLKGDTHDYGSARVDKTPFGDKHPTFERHTVRTVHSDKISSAVSKRTYKIKKAAAKGKKKVERFLRDYEYLLYR